VTSSFHLELATDLNTETFLAALRRFISRRGTCSHIFSDNERNFVGAMKVLDDMYQLILSQQHNTQVTHALASEGIKWSFIPPYARHSGEKWDSAVRSVKLPSSHLSKCTPVWVKLSPSSIHAHMLPDRGHLLIRRPYTSVPEGDISHVAVNRLDYWQNVQAMLQGFWKR